MFTKHTHGPAQLKVSGSQEGSIEAVFSTFNVVDLDGDLTLPTAFQDGQEVIMCWAHDWSAPIGKGVVRVDPDRAVFVGRFWLDTMAGDEAWKRVKNAGQLQEFSYGYSVLDNEYGTVNGQRVRILKDNELYEVSPVLKGAAGAGSSYTLSVKERQARQGTTVTESDVLVAALRANGIDVPYPKGSPFYDHQSELRGMLREARRLGVRV